MSALIVGSIFIVTLLLILTFPLEFRRLMGRITSQDEASIPDYPISAAAPLLLLLVWALLIPGIQSVATVGGTTYKHLAVAVITGILFLIAGMGLAIWPESLSATLKWPRLRSNLHVFTSRLVGADLVIGGSWLIHLLIEK